MTSAHQAWLRRVSDYHSGGVSESERLAVEAHLKECSECEEALTMYRHFYSLLGSPLRLGAPSAGFDEVTAPIATLSKPRASSPGPRDPRQRRDRNRALTGIAAGLAAALIIAGFVAVIAPHLRAPTASSTPAPSVTASGLTPQPLVTATSSLNLTPAPYVAPFICANPAGSNLVYAYQRADNALYVVTGCSTPRLLTRTPVIPLDWSPSNRYLAVWTNYSAVATVEIIDTQTGQMTTTQSLAAFSVNVSPGDQTPIFFGWLDNTDYLVGLTTVTSNAQGFLQEGPTTLQRVSVLTGASATIGSLNGWINGGSLGIVSPRMAANGRYLYYAGYDAAGTTAYLHRFDTTTRTDSQLVSLGAYVNGNCQGTPLCGWTAPWDASSDGAHILYHHPGAASGPTDISAPGDTPLVEVSPDGSGATQPFGSKLGSNLSIPVFAPDGTLELTTGANYTGGSGLTGPWQILLTKSGGGTALIAGNFIAWRGDSAAFVFFDPNASGGSNSPQLYTVATGATRPLEDGASNYIWGNGG